jgi:hypothetical protein
MCYVVNCEYSYKLCVWNITCKSEIMKHFEGVKMQGHFMTDKFLPAQNLSIHTHSKLFKEIK